MPGDKSERCYNYGFCVNKEGVTEEWLNSKAKTARKYSTVFYRGTTDEELDLSGLRRDEIWFVEKDERGVSTLYSLADFVDEDGSRIRKDESYEKNYLIGKYGAIPTLKNIDVLKED